MRIDWLEVEKQEHFRGHHLPVVSVMVDRNTTYRQIMEGLLDYQTWEHLEGEDDFDKEKYFLAVEEYFDDTLDFIDKVPTSIKHTHDFSWFEEDEETHYYVFFTLGENHEL